MTDIVMMSFLAFGGDIFLISRKRKNAQNLLFINLDKDFLGLE